MEESLEAVAEKLCVDSNNDGAGAHEYGAHGST